MIRSCSAMLSRTPEPRCSEKAAGLLAHTTTAAAHKLAEIIDTGEERHALTASRIVLDMASRYRIDQALESRIIDLEMAAGLKATQ